MIDFRRLRPGEGTIPHAGNSVAPELDAIRKMPLHHGASGLMIWWSQEGHKLA
jgi:hypothetical protein